MQSVKYSINESIKTDSMLCINVWINYPDTESNLSIHKLNFFISSSARMRVWQPYMSINLKYQDKAGAEQGGAHQNSISGKLSEGS